MGRRAAFITGLVLVLLGVTGCHQDAGHTDPAATHHAAMPAYTPEKIYPLETSAPENRTAVIRTRSIPPAMVLPEDQKPPVTSPKRPLYEPPAGAPPPVPVYWFGLPTGRHVYITIDDGWVPSLRVLSLMQRTHLPLTAFLIRNAMQEHLAYWKAFVAAGGLVEDHTVSHPDLVFLPYPAVVSQWTGARIAEQQWLGQFPALGRPPYGGLDPTVERAAAAAGLKGIVMWSASVGPRGIATWNGRPLQPGDIILMHWDSGLYPELERLLTVLSQDRLTVAPLVWGLPSSAR